MKMCMKDSKPKDRICSGEVGRETCYIKEGAWGRVNSIGAKGEEYDKVHICPWAASTVGRVLTLESNRF